MTHTCAATKRHAPPAFLLTLLLTLVAAVPRPAQAGPTSLTYTGQLLASLSPPTAAQRPATTSSSSSTTPPRAARQVGPPSPWRACRSSAGSTTCSSTSACLHRADLLAPGQLPGPPGRQAARPTPPPRPGPSPQTRPLRTTRPSRGPPWRFRGRASAPSRRRRGRCWTYNGTLWVPALRCRSPARTRRGRALAVRRTTFSIPCGGVTSVCWARVPWGPRPRPAAHPEGASNDRS